MGVFRYEILHYLNDAKQRMEGHIVDFDSCTEEGETADVGLGGLGQRNAKHRVSASSNLSDSSSSSTESGGEGGVLWRQVDRLASR